MSMSAEENHELQGFVLTAYNGLVHISGGMGNSQRPLLCREKRFMALLLVGTVEKSDRLIGRHLLQGLFLIHLDTAASIFDGIHVWQRPHLNPL
jgi:hypothetical protein